MVGGAGNIIGYTEQASAVVIDSALTVADSDNQNLATATVTISNGFQSGDVLAATVTGTSITAVYNAGTHVLTLSGSDTLAHYQQVLDSVTFANTTNDNPTNFGANPSRTISWIVNDGALDSNTGSTTINVTAVNDAPVPAAKSFTVQSNMKITGLTGLTTGATDPNDPENELPVDPTILLRVSDGGERVVELQASDVVSISLD